MKAIVRFMVFVMALSAADIVCSADVCQIVNGSFEDDSYIADITEQEPNSYSQKNLMPGIWNVLNASSFLLCPVC